MTRAVKEVQNERVQRIPAYVIAALIGVILTILPAALWPDMAMPMEENWENWYWKGQPHLRPNFSIERPPRLFAFEVRVYKALVAPGAFAARAITGWPTSYASFFIAPYRETAGLPPLAMAIEHARWSLPIWLIAFLALAEVYLALRRRKRRLSSASQARAVLTTSVIFLIGCGAVEPPERPATVPAAAVWAGGADGGAWIACDLLTKEPYVTYACQTYDDAGQPWANGTYAFGRFAVKNSGFLQFEPAGAFARIQAEDFQSFDGVHIQMEDNRALVPHGEIRFLSATATARKLYMCSAERFLAKCSTD